MPCHTARSVKAFLAQNTVDLLEWPAYSPDLNPIEGIWAWMKQELDRKFEPCGSSELIEARFLSIWNEMTDEFVSQYCIK